MNICNKGTDICRIAHIYIYYKIQNLMFVL